MTYDQVWQFKSKLTFHGDAAEMFAAALDAGHCWPISQPLCVATAFVDHVNLIAEDKDDERIRMINGCPQRPAYSRLLSKALACIERSCLSLLLHSGNNGKG